MANALGTFKKYIEHLDEVYKEAALTAVLDGDSDMAQMGANAGEMIIPKMSMDGLADYSRDGGYVAGDVTLNYETVGFNYDRGRAFTIDAMDDEETAGVAFGRLASEFIRTKVAPEMDAFRFAAYAAADGVSKESGNLATGEDVLAALVKAQSEMDDAEVPIDGRYLFISAPLYNLMLNVDTTRSTAVLDSFAGVARVPRSRFFTEIELLDGQTDDALAGGYKKGDGAEEINFLMVQKSSLLQYPKHTVNKIITPEQNQTSDAWKFFYRAYGVADVYENKKAGVYLHTKD